MESRRLLGYCLQHRGGMAGECMAGECILYYSLYNSNAADAVGPPDMKPVMKPVMEPVMEPALHCVKVMQMRPDARSTATSISDSKQDAPQRHWPAGAPVPCRRSLFEGRGDAFGDHDITAGLTGASPAYYACTVGRRTGHCTLLSSFPRACTASHRTAHHSTSTDGLPALAPTPPRSSLSSCSAPHHQSGRQCQDRPEASAKTNPQQLKKSQPTAAAQQQADRTATQRPPPAAPLLALHCTARR